MAANMSLSARDSIKDARNAVSDVITNNILDKKRRQQDTYDRINQEKPLRPSDIKAES